MFLQILDQRIAVFRVLEAGKHYFGAGHEFRPGLVQFVVSRALRRGRQMMPNTGADPMAYEDIPYASEQGIFGGRTGN